MKVYGVRCPRCYKSMRFEVPMDKMNIVVLTLSITCNGCGLHFHSDQDNFDMKFPGPDSLLEFSITRQAWLEYYWQVMSAKTGMGPMELRRLGLSLVARVTRQEAFKAMKSPLQAVDDFFKLAELLVQVDEAVRANFFPDTEPDEAEKMFGVKKNSARSEPTHGYMYKGRDGVEGVAYSEHDFDF